MQPAAKQVCTPADVYELFLRLVHNNTLQVNGNPDNKVVIKLRGKLLYFALAAQLTSSPYCVALQVSSLRSLRD